MDNGNSGVASLQRTPDRAWLDALCRRYARDVQAACRKRLRDSAAAEDAAQDALESLLRHAGSIRDTERPWTWIHTIAARRCVDEMRRQRRALVEPIPSFDEHSAILSGRPVEDPALVVELSERRHAVAEAIRALPSRGRDALLLYALEGWSYEEIAEAAGCSVLAVKSLLFRTREALRRSLSVTLGS